MYFATTLSVAMSTLSGYLVNSADQCATTGTSVSRVPQTLLAMTGCSSDTAETAVSCPSQDPVPASDCNSVAQHSLVSVCLIYGLFGAIDVTETIGGCPVPTTLVRQLNQHKRRLTNVSVPAAITRPMVQEP